MIEEICSVQDSLRSTVTPRNFVENTLLMEILSIRTEGNWTATGEEDLLKKMKLVLVWFKESLFALNQQDT